MEEESSGRHLGGIWEASGDIWEASGRHLGGIWKASGRHLGGIFFTPTHDCIIQCCEVNATNLNMKLVPQRQHNSGVLGIRTAHVYTSTADHIPRNQPEQQVDCQKQEERSTFNTVRDL